MCYYYREWLWGRGLSLPARKRLFAGTVPVNKKYLTGTEPANKEHLTGTVPVNKEHLTYTLYIFWGNEGEMLITIS